ncbi:MAG: inositol monophosphatase family protein [Candidatus Omnitrophota bacterium]
MKDKFKEFAAEIARKTSKYLRRNLGRVKEIGYKEEIINLVTNVDRKVEEIVIKTLQKYFPDDGFLSEEFGEKKGKNNRKWIIDPLDGTTNYAHGFPFYAVSIAVLEDLRPIFGLVFDPERNELFMAAKSKGAYCNKKKDKSL